jgi:L-lactate dehydrogenase (cytochrome)
MREYFNSNFPTINSLREKAQSRIPRFAFEYVDGGCNIELSLAKNTREIQEIELIPYYLRKYSKVSTQVNMFGEVYDMPFGISPIGLQGLIWPNSPEILAESAFQHNIPFILSTVTTLSIEKAAEITEGKAWFQLYHPSDNTLTDDLLKRCQNSGIKTLVLLADAPSWGYRAKEIKNGLSMPPKVKLRNIIDILLSPSWAVETIKKGRPKFESLEKYMSSGSKDTKHLGIFMEKTFDGRLNEERIKRIRDKWKGNLVLKGLSSVEDTEKAITNGFDGIIISNHGGRQFDASPSTINRTTEIVKYCKDKIKIMMDSGIRDGVDIARVLSTGADFTFLGRSFMYSVSALGKNGGHHIINMLKRQVKQVMEQCCCEKVDRLRDHLYKKT